MSGDFGATVSYDEMIQSETAPFTISKTFKNSQNKRSLNPNQAKKSYFIARKRPKIAQKCPLFGKKQAKSLIFSLKKRPFLMVLIGKLSHFVSPIIFTLLVRSKGRVDERS